MELHFESPLEALVLRYSTIIAGYICTILAVFAAGIGLWRFRLLGSVSRPSTSPAPKLPSAAVSPVITLPMPTLAPIASTIVLSDRSEGEESGTSTKGRFTAYFLVEEEIDDGGKGDENEWGSYDIGVVGECLDLLDWGRRGDLGWYRYQDWKAISGSVVRLWDGSWRGSGLAPAVKGR